KLKEINAEGSPDFRTAGEAVAHAAQAVKEHLEKELLDLNLLENYKDTGQRLIEITSAEICSPETKKAILTSIINNCLSELIEQTLETRQFVLHRDLTEYSATILNDQQKAKISTLKEKR
ncbi:9727_t:CDS:2, partial [Funneliformis geosporum]